MTNEKKMELIAEILDVDVEDISPETVLADIEEWDSVAALSFIAMMDDEFGKNYANLAYCHSKEEYAENDRIANEILARKPLDEDILDFLYDSDTTGQISHKVCKKIYDLIQDIDFGKKSFRYGAYAHNDYEEFKTFLKECYSNRRYMRWS